MYQMQVTVKTLEIVWSFYGRWMDYWNSESNITIRKNAERLGVKEKPYLDFIKVDKFICPILQNQINLENNVFHNLLDYSNKYTEKLSVEGDIVYNYLIVIDSLIHERINLREEFDISE